MATDEKASDIQHAPVAQLDRALDFEGQALASDGAEVGGWCPGGDRGSETPAEKRCPRCKKKTPRSNFSRDRRRPDGLQVHCKKCCAKKARAHYERNAGRVRAATRAYASENPRKRAAHRAVQRAIKLGELVPTPCERCGSASADAHHDDYDKPLAVRWLCRSCHVRHHVYIDRLARAAGAHADLVDQLAEADDCG